MIVKRNETKRKMGRDKWAMVQEAEMQESKTGVYEEDKGQRQGNSPFVLDIARLTFA
jgi:hypothetical protein